MRYKDNNISLLAAFLAFIHEQGLIQKGETTLLAVSGGVDSVVMSMLFYQAKLRFALAHCNFRLRGIDSDQDEAFVHQLAQQYGVKLYTQSFDTLAYAHRNGLSTQMAARKLRYQWFEELCAKHYLNKIATAHHGNDSMETLLLNLTRGTGIAGLRGMLPRQGRLIRPLLFADKAMLLQYAQTEKLAWRADSSNLQNSYARNFVRNKVIPLLKKVNPKLEVTSRLTMERLGQIEAVFNEHVAAIRKQILHQRGESYHIAIQAIKDKFWAPAVVWELLKPFGFHFLQLKGLFRHNSQSGKRLDSPSYQLYVDRSEWIITPRNRPSQTTHTITNASIRTLETQDYRLQMTVIPRAQYTLIPDSRVAALDLARLTFPLVIRKWQPGDFFYPLGMQTCKKLSDFLVDLKVALPLKDSVYVLVAGNEIVWVMGHRIDDRFKITNTTRAVYEAQLTHVRIGLGYH